MLEVKVKDSYMWDEVHLEHIQIEESIKNNKEVLSKIAKEVKSKKIKHAIFVGRGSSEHALQVAKYFYEIECGIFAEMFSPSVITRYNANLDFSDKLVIGISQCGEAKDVWSVLEAAKAQGATVVSMTNNDNCLMSQIDDYYVNLLVGKENSYTAAKSYLSQAALTIYLGALIKGDPNMIENLENCGKLIERSYEAEKGIREAMPLFRNVENIMILGRGYSYAVALEAELKIQEANYTSGRAYASSDYQHGPIATTPRFTPFIVFLTDEKTDDTTVQLLKKLQKDFSISSLIVTNKEKYLGLGDYSILMPTEGEGYMSLFTNALFSQMFACILSFARGYHPDKPTGLSKVTVTF